ncbi:hypothetical protein N8T08_003791 [Aspergillus melleus]|uniref:Uncharacterized protein n=1 Tax=Aspergillus melleus TaxID=138277 RepID=A0ACC3B746_9EURO|nr:hypothetical protein N8T08_003791 [Aspergillus melleus]
MVNDAHRALEVANRGRLTYPDWNQYRFQDEQELKGTFEKAPALDYDSSGLAKETSPTHIARDNANTTRFRYTISPQLAEAARVIAEAFPSPVPTEYGVNIAKVVGKYRVTPNDTNTPRQVHHAPNGLDIAISPVSDNEEGQGGVQHSDLRKRAANNDYWLTELAKKGSSPFAPAGYKVFRNVKDYGAKGDGVTDDTAAINLAISDGGRCGADCGSSTIYPAFVYFPPGTYLVSSSIIQYYNTEFFGNGIYMENGSGGFLTNLTFVGGNFGAYFGNQQFTTSQLNFLNCKTALQIHWDWAWTMQDVIINNCTQGIVIIGGAGGAGSTGQSVGSLILLDTVIAFTDTAILTSLMSENSTSFLLQNANFIQVDTAIKDSVKNRVLMAGGSHVTVESWGFGLLETGSTNSSFVNGQHIPSTNRSSSLTGPDGYFKKNWFQRRRPAYTKIGMSHVIDVKAWGAAGDGTTDDTGALNSILDRAANLSSIVYFPFGVYKITDTLRVPVGSRIMDQAWSQIMATGAKFENEKSPHVAVKVGSAGDVGVIEIQSMMFTVSGPTAGAVLMEWNVHESVQGSSGMWDSHFRVGGAIGSNLQRGDCPKTGGVNSKCKAASLLLHLTPKSSAYLENIWLWTADHDLDVVTQDQISVYVARGVLVESQGPTWLYGTASEHNVFYQYQLSQAKDVFMGMIQTESPYFQPAPKAPAPFSPGLFPNDPTFSDCDASSATCALSWALRIIDSSSIYSMGSGKPLHASLLSVWFSNYEQDCLDTENCQQRGVDITQSTDVWLYNVVTKAIVEMISPANEKPTLSAKNMNGFMASILAWVREQDKVIGEVTFPGFQIYDLDNLNNVDGLTSTCKTALSQAIRCSPFLETFRFPNIGKYIENSTEADMVCAPSCGASLKSWFDNVSSSCTNQSLGFSDPSRYGGYIYAAYNQTCLKDPKTGQYCQSIVNEYPAVANIRSLPLAQLCSYCFKQKYIMRQASAYTVYDVRTQENLETINVHCGLSGPTELPESLVNIPPTPKPMCLSELTYTIQENDTCDKIALKYSVASAAIMNGNSDLINDCSRLIAGREICIPLSCENIYTLQDNDTCFSIEVESGLDIEYGGVRKFNPWVDADCFNLQSTRPTIGSVICLSPQAGTYNDDDFMTATEVS